MFSSATRTCLGLIVVRQSGRATKLPLIIKADYIYIYIRAGITGITQLAPNECGTKHHLATNRLTARLHYAVERFWNGSGTVLTVV